MHNRQKVQTTEAEKAAKKKEREKKLQLFTALNDDIRKRRSSGVHDQDTLDLIAKMLLRNPDILTCWNYRREILEDLLLGALGDEDETTDVPDQAADKLLSAELQLTEGCLMENPKSYGAWHHRGWVLTKMKNPNFKKEIAHCNEALKLDDRNFHCWDYRRLVCQMAALPFEQELEFTNEMISNFSNYSAWHYRSNLLPKLFPDESGKLTMDEDHFKEELDLLRSAFFTDPEDSSAWFYHRWLLRQPERTELAIDKISIDLVTNRLAVKLSKPCVLSQLNPVVSLSIASDDPHQVVVVWKTVDNARSSAFWFCQFSEMPRVPPDLSTYRFSVSLTTPGNDSTSCRTWCSDISVESGAQFAFKDCYDSLCFAGEQSVSEDIRRLLEQELDDCQTLYDMDPNVVSKWPLMNAVLTMGFLNPKKHSSKMKENLDLLARLDSKRSLYYADFLDKCVFEDAVVAQLNSLNSGCLLLPGRGLSVLGSTTGLLQIRELDVSNNALTSLSALRYVLNLVKLNVDDNKIACISGLEDLLGLEELSLCRNRLKSANEVIPMLSGLNNLKSLNIVGNDLNEREIHDALHLAFL